MKEDMSEKDKKVSRKEFRYDLLSENSQDVFEEVMESSRDKSTTTIIEKICVIAYRKIRKPEALHSMTPPNCGWCIYHPEYGDICIFGIPKPIRIALIKHRKLRYFDCELCAILDLKREEAKQLKKIKEKEALKEMSKNPSNIKFESGYKASRDIKRFVLKYRTLSPVELSEYILDVKAVDKSPEAIGVWLKRHPAIHEELKKILAGDKEAEKKMRESLEKKKKKKTPQEMIEEYAR